MGHIPANIALGIVMGQVVLVLKEPLGLAGETQVTR